MKDIKLFQSAQIRSIWNDEAGEWFFSVVDVVGALTDSADKSAYWRKLKQRMKAEGNETVTNCHRLKLLAEDGKMRLTDTANTEGILRIIQSIPSPKAEPFKRWLAQVGADRLHQMQDPELGIQQSLADFKRLGYSDNWINQRLKSIEIRKDLTDQWKAHGVDECTGYATLTDIIYQSWAGLTAKKYKQLKGLRKENLRDNMTNEELVMNMLAELTTTNITKEEHPISMSEHAQAASRGGSVARVAREAFEQQTGKKVVTNLNMKRFLEKQQPQLDFSGDSEDKDK